MTGPRSPALLGGPERRTLFLLSSTDAYPQRLIGHEAVAARCGDRRRSRRGPAVSDSYHELIDESDAQGARFTATDLVRSTRSAAIRRAAAGVGAVGAPAAALRGARRHSTIGTLFDESGAEICFTN